MTPRLFGIVACAKTKREDRATFPCLRSRFTILNTISKIIMIELATFVFGSLLPKCQEINIKGVTVMAFQKSAKVFVAYVAKHSR